MPTIAGLKVDQARYEALKGLGALDSYVSRSTIRGGEAFNFPKMTSKAGHQQEVSMSKLIALGVAAASGVIAFRCLPQQSRRRLSAAAGDWVEKRMMRHMERMMASLPDNAPPKLIMSILPKLQAQNEQIIAMLQEQNELIRQQQRGAPGGAESRPRSTAGRGS